MGKEEVREKYNKFAPKYDRWEGVLEFSLIGGMRRKLLGKARGKVLDVGIGTGKNLRHYQKGCRITGIDYSLGMLEIAKKRAEKLCLNVRFSEGDVENLPFNRGEFDFVIDTLGLCTYPNPVRALKEMKRVCRKKGRILLLEHGKSSNAIIRWLQGKIKKKQLERLGCHVDRDILGLVDKAGLKIMKWDRRFFGIFYVIAAKP